MKTKPAVRDGFPVVCKKHINETLREKDNGFMFCRICKRNRIARDRNQILRDLCGTSARAAKLDMGL